MKDELFDDVYDIDASELAMQRLASDFILLLKHVGVTREQFAELTGYSINYISRILSGDVNMSIHDITVLAEALGYSFDIVFFNEEYERPLQPWTIDKQNSQL